MPSSSPSVTWSGPTRTAPPPTAVVMADLRFLPDLDALADRDANAARTELREHLLLVRSNLLGPGGS